MFKHISIAAVISVIIASLFISASHAASATRGEICSTLRLSVDTPRGTFREIYGDRGERESFSTRGQLIVIKHEVRSWTVCGDERSYSFTKVGTGRWTLSR